MRPLADLLPHNQEQVKETLARQRELAEKRRNDFLPTSQCTKPKKKINEDCPICKGQVLYLVQYPNGRMEMQTCPNCADMSKTSGLSEFELNLTIDSIVEIGDKTGSHAVLKAAAQYIIDGRGATFINVFGTTGNAKSLWAKSIIATLCRNGILSHYTRGRTVEKSLFGDSGDENAKANRPGVDFYSRIKALVVDEAHAMNWRSSWVAAGLQEILDSRYEASMQPSGRKRQLTILISQIDPIDWAPDWLLDRLRQGSHAIPWTSSEVPVCLQERPCPRCGDGVMRYNGKWLACECGHDRDVEIFFPFRDMADSARPIMPVVTHGGW